MDRWVGCPPIGSGVKREGSTNCKRWGSLLGYPTADNHTFHHSSKHMMDFHASRTFLWQGSVNKNCSSGAPGVNGSNGPCALTPPPVFSDSVDPLPPTVKIQRPLQCTPQPGCHLHHNYKARHRQGAICTTTAMHPWSAQYWHHYCKACHGQATTCAATTMHPTVKTRSAPQLHGTHSQGTDCTTTMRTTIRALFAPPTQYTL